MKDNQYESIMKELMEQKPVMNNRTGIATRSLFGKSVRYNLQEGFPLITTKRVHTKSVIEELLWMMSGSTNNNDLLEKGVTIWNAWADPDTGDLGPVYGYQWRYWWDALKEKPIDQIVNLIQGIKDDPTGRRHIVTAWNVADLQYMALPPCHMTFQVYIRDNKLSLHCLMRSVDWFLGAPFDIASYSFMTHMLAQQTGYDVGELMMTFVDCHLYENHIEQATKQVARDVYDFPQVKIKKAKDLFSYTRDSFEIVGYQHHPGIAAPVAV